MKIEFYRHSLGTDEKKKVQECIDGVFLTTGEYVKEFEEHFARYFGMKYCVGLTSCTAALHLSLLAIGIGPGDEVITTPMTFIATANAIMHVGAKPVFVDVEPDTALIDPKNIEAAMTKKTKAIIPVHLYGQLCDMVRIKRLADKYGLKIIEDSAHCIEGIRDNVRPGQLSDVACFSFYATKNMTSGEGGAIVTKNQEIADKVKILRQHGMSKEAADRYRGNYKHWDMIECGWKYNMDNIQACLLLPQLTKIESNWERRREIYEIYSKSLGQLNGISLPKIVEGAKSAYHLFTILVDKHKRDFVLKEYGDRGIGVAVNYRAIHLLSYYRNKFGFRQGDYPVSEDIGAKTISLPFYPKLKEKEINWVIKNTSNIVS